MFGSNALTGKRSFLLKDKKNLIIIVLLFSLSLLSILAVSPAHAAATTTGLLTVNNSTVGLGQQVSVNGSGYLPDEQVALWLTAPDGQAYSYGRVYAYDGAFSGYTNSWSDDALIHPGTWHITAQGITSGQTAYATFTMVQPTLQASASPVGGGMSKITVDAYNWFPGERITMWITDMSGDVKYVGYAWVYQDGSIIEGKSFDVALLSGTYRLSAYGNTSGVIKVTSFIGF